MQTGNVSTPFGRRPISLALVRRQLTAGEIRAGKCFCIFFHAKPVHQACMAPSATILLIMASQGALAPRLARSIRVLGHPYSSMWGTNTSPKRGDRLWVPHKRGMGSIAIVIRGMWKFDRKIMVASFLPSWLQSAPMARLGALLCAQYRPPGAQIRVYGPLACVPRLCGGGN